jgi:dipeptidyl aminopeptidase/acylaminoacyl peptidase
VYLRFVLDQVGDERDRAAIEEAYGAAIRSGDRPAPEPRIAAGLRSDAARTVDDLVTAGSATDARRTIDRLPAESLAFVDTISPLRHLDAIAARVWLMHEREDHHVPYVESRYLADALRERGLLEAHTEFRLFDHVQPDDLDPLAAAPELWRLLLHLRELMEETL